MKEVYTTPSVSKAYQTMFGLIFLLGFTPLTAESVSWTGGAGDGLWATAGNWSTAAAPTSTADVTIGINVTIDFIASQTVNSITIPSGTTVVFLNSSASSKNLTLSAGTSTIAGTLQLVPTGQTATNSARIVMAAGSTLNITGTLEAGGGSTTANNVTNAAGCTINVTGTFIYYNTFVATGGVLNVNSGGKVVVKSGSTTTGSDATTVNVKSGATWEHARNGGTIATANYATGSTLLITGVTTATTALAFPATITTFSTVTFDNPNQAANVTLPTGLTIGTLNINNTGINGNVVRMASGSTVGAVALTVTNALNIANGTAFYLIYTTGTSTQTPSAALTMGSGSTVTINTGATLGLSDKSSLGGVLTLGSGGSLTNSGNLFCSGGVSYIDGAGAVNLNTGGFTKIGDPNGIVAGSTTMGNIRNSGARNFNAGHDWSFNTQGSSQVTGDGMPSTCANFTSNSNVGVTITNPLTVSNTLTITGNLSLANNDLTATAVSGGSQATHVITNGTGKLIVPNISTTTFFPVGASSSSFDPVYITPSSAGTYGVRVDSVFDNTPIAPDKVVNREWAITRTSGSGTAEISFIYNAAATTGASYNPVSPMVIGSWGSSWTEKSATISGTTVTAMGLSNFSFFGVGNTNAFATVIPIELSKFEVKATAKTAQLTWVTASERNNAYFNIEQSTNGIDFQTISQVKGQGTTATATTYNFEHNTPSVGINYYRLKQIDANGAFTYSPIRSVVFGKNVFVIKNTLVHDALDILTNEDAATPLSIFNISGLQVWSGKAQGAQSISISALPAGLYIVRTATGATGRFVKE